MAEAVPIPKKGLFGSKKPVMPAPATAPNEEMATLARRLRLLEERYGRVENNLRTIEDHLNDLTRDFSRMLNSIKSKVDLSNSRLDEMQDRMLVFIKELQLLSKKEDVDVIKKYINYWNPVKFVQATQVEKIVKDVLHELGLINRL